MWGLQRSRAVSFVLVRDGSQQNVSSTRILDAKRIRLLLMHKNKNEDASARIRTEAWRLLFQTIKRALYGG